MGLIECASNNSIWRAIDYVERDKVICWNTAGDDYDGLVEGSEKQTYKVHVDKNHPRKSTCTCPFAQEHRVICKHMLAIYFSAEPKVLSDFLEEVDRYEREEEERQNRHVRDLYEYARRLSKEELVDELVSAWLEREEYRDSRW